jgi:hypothetical protein
MERTKTVEAARDGRNAAAPPPGSRAVEHHRERLTAVDVAVGGSADSDPAGEFEVLAITAGEGNGWVFSEAVLRESLALWDGAECFVDHAWYSRSVRDLAGQLTAPAWDAERRGVKCRLRPVGPSAGLLVELGRQVSRQDLSEGKSQGPRVGFSADVVFSAEGRRVKKIVRVLSVDLVFNPARGGAFLRALNNRYDGGWSMAEDAGAGMQGQGEAMDAGAQNVATHYASTHTASLTREMEQERDAVREAAVRDAARSTRAEMCACLLESELAAARLPAPVGGRIRQQFAGRVYEHGELSAAIADARKLVSELTAAGAIQGPGRTGSAGRAGRISGMTSSEEQFTAALFDLLGAERPRELSGVKSARLSGIRELYTLMTGDVDFCGGYDAERVQFATTADLPGVLKNAMNKLIVQEWQELGRSGYRWWEPIVAREHFTSLQQVTGVLVGEVTVLPTVAEGAAYTALGVTDSPEVASWSKYGGYIGLTLEMFERDETHKLRQYPRKLASAGLRRISALVGSVFTSGGGVGPNMADGAAVFGAPRGNLGTTALSAASWETASSAIYNQQMLVAAGGTAPRLALDAKYLLVPRALRLTGWQILYPNLEHAANIHSENMQRGEMGDVITCPEMTDANDWAAVADPRLAPGIVIADRFGLLPEIIIADQAANGALFTNDEIRMKARHWLAVLVADYRPLYKGNVA